MDECEETLVEYHCRPVRWTTATSSSFYDHCPARPPFSSDQLIAPRESYPAQQVPAAAAVSHHHRHASLYHHYRHHHHQLLQGRGGRGDVTAGPGYDDVTESRCVTSFIELQPAPAGGRGRSLVVESLDGGTGDWSSASPPFAHSQHRKSSSDIYITSSFHCRRRRM